MQSAIGYPFLRLPRTIGLTELDHNIEAPFHAVLSLARRVSACAHFKSPGVPLPYLSCNCSLGGGGGGGAKANDMF